jgi:hypothetical protein
VFPQEQPRGIDRAQHRPPISRALTAMEPPMHTLDTYDLVLNSLVVVMMPLIIWANLRTMGLKSPLHTVLWRDHTNLMRTSLVILALLTAFSAIELLAHFGVISGDVADLAAPAIGIPFLIVSLVMIWFAAGAGLKVFRDWRGGHKET